MSPAAGRAEGPDEREEREDRRRAVHELTRRIRRPRPARERLDVEELAGLISGSLTPPERRAAEALLMVSEEERDRVARVRRDFDRGLVPLSRRRTRTGPVVDVGLPTRFARRYGLIALSVLVFALVVTLPFSVKRWLEGERVAVPEPVLVVGRVGTPVAVSGGEPAPARVGAWLAADEALRLEAGDLVDGLARDGSIVRLDADGVRRSSGPDALLAGLHRAAGELESAPVPEVGGPDAVGMEAAAWIIHPRGRVLDERPVVAWFDAERRPADVAILDEDGTELVRGRGEEGRWAYPAASVRLPPDRALRAVVRVRGGDAIVAEARFRTLAADERARVQAALRELERRFGSDRSLLRAVLLMSEGLDSEARIELEDLRLRETENPAPVRWLERVWARLGIEPLRRRMAELSDKRGI